jgi:hypothetical protein
MNQRHDALGEWMAAADDKHLEFKEELVFGTGLERGFQTSLRARDG